MKLYEHDTVTIGAPFLCALINGDDSGMSEDDAAALDVWEKGLPLPVVYDYDIESEVARDCVTGQMGDCYTVRIMANKVAQ